ncbi:MAG TPA: hypothetical protein VHC49_13905 [Mycobacteriales bacterium]|nr:hypothetical protein [Mycobacteriales bacterium]
MLKKFVVLAGGIAATGTLFGGVATASAATQHIGCDYTVAKPLAAVWSQPGAGRHFIKYKNPGDGVVSPDKCGTKVSADGNNYTRVNYAGGVAWMATNMLSNGTTHANPRWDGGFGSAAENAYWSQFPTVSPLEGGDVGRIQSWHFGPNSQIIASENRVTEHRDDHAVDPKYRNGYTDVNSKIRQYPVAGNVYIQVDDANYRRITKKNVHFSGLRVVTKEQFFATYSEGASQLRDQTAYRIGYSDGLGKGEITLIQATAVPRADS